MVDVDQALKALRFEPTLDQERQNFEFLLEDDEVFVADAANARIKEIREERIFDKAALQNWEEAQGVDRAGQKFLDFTDSVFEFLGGTVENKGPLKQALKRGDRDAYIELLIEGDVDKIEKNKREWKEEMVQFAKNTVIFPESQELTALVNDEIERGNYHPIDAQFLRSRIVNQRQNVEFWMANQINDYRRRRTNWAKVGEVSNLEDELQRQRYKVESINTHLEQHRELFRNQLADFLQEARDSDAVRDELLERQANNQPIDDIDLSKILTERDLGRDVDFRGIPGPEGTHLDDRLAAIGVDPLEAHFDTTIPDLTDLALGSDDQELATSFGIATSEERYETPERKQQLKEEAFFETLTSPLTIAGVVVGVVIVGLTIRYARS